MTFIRYPHLERFGNAGVQDIEFGVTHVFPKLDGTNASVWHEDGIKAGSRNRVLSVESDNAGFFAHILEKEGTPERIRAFLNDNKNLIITRRSNSSNHLTISRLHIHSPTFSSTRVVHSIRL